MRINCRVLALLPIILPVALILLAFSFLGRLLLFVGSMFVSIGEVKTPKAITSILDWAKGKSDIDTPINIPSNIKSGSDFSDWIDSVDVDKDKKC